MPALIPFVSDPDFTLYVGDALKTLRQLPYASVDCCVTSPPYWGLRDYGTEGQLGLEPTPDEFIASMVAVFAEVRRVLAPHGTCWVNLGDSYNANQRAGFNGQVRQDHANRHTVMPRHGFKAKDLVGIPWMVAFALRADGWYLRSDIIWAKSNPMPESITDRPTKAHEYMFLLAKQPRYWFDQEALREPAQWERWGDQTNGKHEGSGSAASWIKPKSKQELTGKNRPSGRGDTYSGFNERWNQDVGAAARGRNIRSVWQIATQPYPEAHFATFPEELARRCIVAGCPEWVCRRCGKARERIVAREFVKTRGNAGPNLREDLIGYDKGARFTHPLGYGRYDVDTLGWSDCGHNDYRPGVVLDPFMGSGTVAFVARANGRACIGIELNPEYCELIARRTQQLSLIGEGSA